jgi:hypothetical protein
MAPRSAVRRALLLWDVDSGSAMMTFQCDSGDNRHRINVTHMTLQVVEQTWQDVVEQFICSWYASLTGTPIYSFWCYALTSRYLQFSQGLSI